MFHHYFGTGNVVDLLNISRSINATMLISDQLMTWNPPGKPGQPVYIPSGQPIPNGQYCFAISDWKIVIEKICTFYGSLGSIYLEFLPPATFGDKMWMFNSDADNASGYYRWSGQIDRIETPSAWGNPKSHDYGHLPCILDCNLTYLPPSIGNLFNITETACKKSILLTRVH